MTSAPQIDPDEGMFRNDMTLDAFLVGAASDHWEIFNLDWPYVFTWIEAASRPNSPSRFALRLTCSGYPSRGPTGTLWNQATNGPLEHAAWPKGRQRFAHVFRTDWEGGLSLYHPYDGLALEKHPEWTSKYTARLWTPRHTITDWLAEFHELLNCDEYEGVR